MKLNEYYLPDSLYSITESLADPQLCFEADRNEVNQLVVNLVSKYLLSYLEVEYRGIDEIRERVNHAINSEYRQAAIDKRVFLTALKVFEPQAKLKDTFSTSDIFALECLADIAATSAIVKEIIFNDSFTHDGMFWGLDFGSGSGILMLASLIAARRKEVANIVILGFEQQKDAIQRSRKLLETLLRINEIVNIFPSDITNPNIYKMFVTQEHQHWISETISSHTPKLIIENDRLRALSSKDQFYTDLAKNIDPFPIVLDQTIKARPSFVSDVREAKIAMFPDIVNGLFQPDGSSTEISLITSLVKNHVPLYEINSEFLDFEPIIEIQENHVRFP